MSTRWHSNNKRLHHRRKVAGKRLRKRRSIKLSSIRCRHYSLLSLISLGVPLNAFTALVCLFARGLVWLQSGKGSNKSFVHYNGSSSKLSFDLSGLGIFFLSGPFIFLFVTVYPLLLNIIYLALFIRFFSKLSITNQL